MRGLSFDLLILDVMMPGESGVSLAADLRQARDGVPILMLSALTDAADRIKGLAAGSDDYLGKPFEPDELLLRVRSLLRRAGPAPAALGDVRFGDFVFTTDSGELTKAGQRVHLTSRERDLLRLLAQAQGRPVARAALAAPGVEDQARAVDVQINRLRQKLEDDPSAPAHLQTVRGEGYVLLAARG
jgi:two-component system, OmpR family, phosphate regulon response regulator OmpR